MSSSFQFDAKKWAARVRQVALRSLSPDRKIVVLFTTKYAIPRQLKDKILELSVRKRQSSFSIVFIFVSCEEKDYYRVVSVGQLSLTVASTAGTASVVLSKTFFRSIFESGGITKHLMTGPSGNSGFCSPRPLMFPSPSPRGTLRSRGNKTHCFP